MFIVFQDKRVLLDTQNESKQHIILTIKSQLIRCKDTYQGKGTRSYITKPHYSLHRVTTACTLKSTTIKKYIKPRAGMRGSLATSRDLAEPRASGRQGCVVTGQRPRLESNRVRRARARRGAARDEGKHRFPDGGTEGERWDSHEAVSTVGSAQHGTARHTSVLPRTEPGPAAPGGARLL